MTTETDTRCKCERCGNYCHHQQSHCDSCQEVRRLRKALLVLMQTTSVEQSGTIAWSLAREALEETPW